MHMKRLAKTTAMLLVLTTALTSFTAPTLGASPFTDLEQAGSWARDAILDVHERGVMKGANGQFRPLDVMTRREVAIVIANALTLDVTDAAAPPFTDVASTDWGYAQIGAIYKAGLMKGDDQGKFRLNDPITREELVAVVVRAMGADTDGYSDKLVALDTDSISPWAKDAMAFAVEAGLITGEGNMLYPKRLTQRQEVALVISRMLAEVVHDKVPTPPPATQPSPTPTTPAPTTPQQPVEQPVKTGAVQVTGKVTGEGSTQPMKHAVVYLYNNEGFSAKATTDENGEYVFAGLKKRGTYYLRAEPAAGDTNFLATDLYKPISFRYNGSKVTPENVVLQKVSTTGKVLSPDGKPVEGAKISILLINPNGGIYRADQTTDQTGTYRLGGMQAGTTYLINVHAPEELGFANPKPVDFRYYPSVQVPDIRLANVQLKGTVTYPSSSVKAKDFPLVHLRNKEGTWSLADRADANGVYGFGGLTQGQEYIITVDRPQDGRYDKTLPYTFTYTGSTMTINLVFPEVNVSGVVYKDKAKRDTDRVANGYVGIKKVGEPNSYHYANTDAQGKYTFYLTDGTYELRADSKLSGLADAPIQILVVQNGVVVENSQVDLVYAPSLLHGVLKKASGEPARHAWVTLVDASGNRVKEDSANEHGEFDFANLPDGNYQLKVDVHPFSGSLTPKIVPVQISNQIPKVLDDIIVN